MKKLKDIIYLFIKLENNSTYTKITLFNLIKIKFSKKKDAWGKRNQHNHTKLLYCNQPEKIIIGKATYGPIFAEINGNGNEKLKIGNFCSIAGGVIFIVSSEHPYKGFSTYPFKHYYLNYKYESKSKGDIIVEDDVWICFNSIILSGVRIGQGAIVAAGSVVTKDVPPYAIVAGNPAKVIKYRFSSTIIEKLLKVDFSKLTEEKIKEIREDLYEELTEENVDKIIERLECNV